MKTLQSLIHKNIRTGIAVLLKTALILSPSLAAAAPQAGDVVAGAARIVQETPQRTQVQQFSDKAIINWQSFNIGLNEQMQFLQPSATAILLNRVIGSDPSSILGQLTANGRIVLVNPNGIFFSKDAKIDVASIIASTHDIKNDDFMAGRLNFNISGKPNAGIINEGTITIQEGGLAALVAPSIRNSGMITARLGKVALASGNMATIDLYGDDLIVFEDSSKISQKLNDTSALIENSGTIQAEGGMVLLTANAAKNVVDQSINMTGMIKARTVDQQGGRIILKGSEGTINIAGTLDASAPRGGDGGFIDTSAAHVTIAPNAVITTASSSGKTGSWLLDPTDYTIAAVAGNMTGTALSNYLASNNIKIATASEGVQNGDIYVNDTISWSSGNTLNLSAHRNIFVNSGLSATNGGSVVFRSDSNASGIGTVTFGSSGHATLTGGGTASIYYNPTSYTAPTSYASGFTGATPTAYMLVNSIQNLQAMNQNFAGSYALGKDLDAGVTSNWNSGAGFNPIGSSSTPFTGIFNGNGHTISDLKINRPSTEEIGLFGYLEDTALVSNVGLVRPVITGHTYVGGLAGYNFGAIISNTSILDGSITGIDGQVGGLVGINWAGDISYSKSSAVVSSLTHSDEVGGLVGSNVYSGTINRSFSTGSVNGGFHVGGLVGHNNGDITNSYSTAAVSGFGNVGGLVGEFHGGAISHSYSTGVVSGTSEVGGLVGYFESGDIASSYWDTQTSGQAASAISQDDPSNYNGTGLTTTQMKNQASYSGWDFASTWGINATAYPHLLFPSAEGSFTNPPTEPTDPPNPPPYVPSYLLSWTTGAPHYSSWDEYLKTNPFVLTVSMNRSIQLDSQGRFIDGMLNPLNYLNPEGNNGMGFAGLQNGGLYRGYYETGSSYNTKLEWAKAALERSRESSKQGNTYDPAVAKMWEDAALARLRLQSRQKADDASANRLGGQSGQGGSESIVQGSLDGSGSDEQSQAIQKLVDDGLLNPQLVRRDQKGSMGVMNDQSTEIQRLLDLGVINRDALIRDNTGNWIPKGGGQTLFPINSTNEEIDKAVQWMNDNKILRADSITKKDGNWVVNVDTSNWPLSGADLSDGLRSVRIQDAINKGTLNPAYVAKDWRGVLRIMNEESTEIQRGILNGTIDSRFYSTDIDGNWQPQTEQQLKAQTNWQQSQAIQKQIDEGSLNPEYIVKGYDGNLRKLNEESIAIKEGIKNGTINPDYVIKHFDGNLEIGGLSKELKNLDEGEAVEKLVGLVNKGWRVFDYTDEKPVLRNLTTDQITDIINDKNLSAEGFDTFSSTLVRAIEPSKLAEVTLDLPEAKRNQLLQVLQHNDTLNLSVADVLNKIPPDKFPEIAPQITISQLSSIERYNPDLIAVLEPSLPSGWQAATKAYEDSVFNISNLGKGIPYSFPVDMPIGQWLNSRATQGQSIQRVAPESHDTTQGI
jgi:filamentous hemagglutinin family protein